MRRPDVGVYYTMKRIRLISVLMIVVVGAAGVVLASMAQGAVSREITIVAKNMAFVVESPESLGQGNPTITVKRGQKITITLRNDDAGMLHDLLIEGLDVRLEAVSCGDRGRRARGGE